MKEMAALILWPWAKRPNSIPFIWVFVLLHGNSFTCSQNTRRNLWHQLLCDDPLCSACSPTRAETLPFKTQRIYNQPRRCRPDKLVIFTALWNKLLGIPLVWCSWSTRLGGHCRWYNQVASNQRILSIVSRTVHLMPPWACNEGHIGEKGK